MKTKEAEAIVKQIIGWQMVLMGVTKRDDLEIHTDLTKYKLNDFIKANQLVKANNKRKEKLQQHWLKKNGKTKGITIRMTLDDRAIAAAYTALHYNPNGEMIALINDVGVGCVTAKYEK